MLAVSCSSSGIQLVGKDGELTTIKPGELANVGIPNEGAVFKGFYTDFSEWQLASGDTTNTYAIGLGYRAGLSQHQIYEFSSAGRHYLVPTLVLMRALLRPNSVTLKSAFYPQGLERIIVPLFDQDNKLKKCVLDPTIYLGRNRSDSFEEVLLWMYCRPSARKMFDSVYLHYRSGVIGIDLPIGRAKLSGKAVRHGEFHLVTHLVISEVDTSEGTIAEFMGHPKTVIQLYKFSNRWPQSIMERTNTSTHIPLEVQGRVALNDDEWEAIKDKFSFDYIRAKHCPRLLINGILSKLSSNKPWRDCAYPTGTWSNASNFYQVLTKKGQWPLIIETLVKLRPRGKSLNPGSFPEPRG